MFFQVAPADFLRHQGGKDLLEKVESLSAKVALHRAELSKNGGVANTLSRTEETASTFSDSEERGLLRPSSKGGKKPEQDGGKKPSNNEATLQIEIEPGMMSIRAKEAMSRDRRVNPEFTEG